MPQPEQPAIVEQTVTAAFEALVEIDDHAFGSTRAWIEKLGSIVHGRPLGLTLKALADRLRARADAGDVRGASLGNLSKAATVWRVLVVEHGCRADWLCEFRQRDLYQAACLVEQGRLTIDEATQHLVRGTLPTLAQDEPGGSGDEPTPQPTPDTDPLLQAVYDAACVGATAARMPVLDWVKAQAASALLKAA